jgi:hypothetical protein
VGTDDFIWQLIESSQLMAEAANNILAEGEELDSNILQCWPRPDE